LEQHSRNQNAENLKSWPCGFFNINSCKINNYDVKILKTRIKNKELKNCSTDLKGRLHRLLIDTCEKL